jgi:hypothetical protein
MSRVRVEKERREFINIAPHYYAMAIIMFFQEQGETPASLQDIQRVFTYIPEPSEDNPPYCYLEHALLFDRAAALLVQKEMLAVIPDRFGPTIFQPASKFDEGLQKLVANKTLPYYKMHLTAQGSGGWLRTALVNVNSRYRDLDIQPWDIPEDGEMDPEFGTGCD